MKYFLVATIAMMIGTGAWAQKIGLGVEAGMSLSSMAIRHGGEQVKTGMAPGLKAGILADIRFNDLFSIQPALYYNQKGYEHNSAKTALPYIELPVNFQFRFPLGAGHFFTGGGPYAAYLLNNDKAAYEIGQITSAPHLKPFDMGININGGYLLRGSLFVRANAGFGFMNLNPEGNTENALRNCSLSFTVGYMLSK